MKRMNVIRSLTVSIVLAISVAAVPAVYAAPPCSASTLTGSYAMIQPAGFTANGSSTTGGEVPWQFVGVATFDGNGGLNAKWTAAVNGVISGSFFTRQAKGATYTVNSDCTGLISLNGPDAYGTIDIVVIGSGAELFGIWDIPGGSTATFDAKKQ